MMSEADGLDETAPGPKDGSKDPGSENAAGSAKAGRESKPASSDAATRVSETAANRHKIVDLIPVTAWSRPRFGRNRLVYGAAAAALGVAIVLGGGLVAGANVIAAHYARSAPGGPAPETTASLLHHVEDEVRSLKVGLDALRANAEAPKQEDAIRGLKKSVDILKQDLEAAKATNSGAVGQLSAKLDKLDRDPTPKLAEISARLDRIDREPTSKLADIAARLDRLDRDPGPKLSEITARLDRIEHQISSAAPTGSVTLAARAASVPVPVPTPAPAPATVADKAPTPQSTTVEGWMPRDVYNGVALVEGRAGLREVSPGEFLPGAGEIRSIERRGRAWVVVTSRGIIEADNRW